MANDENGLLILALIFSGGYFLILKQVIICLIDLFMVAQRMPKRGYKAEKKASRSSWKAGIFYIDVKASAMALFILNLMITWALIV